MYDPVKRMTVMFGGVAPAGIFQDLWVYDLAGNTWTELTPGFGPPPLRLGSMVYDPDSGLSVLYASGQVWLLRLGSFSEDGNPVPSLVSMSPSTASPGQEGFTLTVTGGGFLPLSSVRWNGRDRPTTHVGPGQLTAAISAADVASAGLASVSVFNPAPGGGTSSALPFNVVVAGKDVVIEGLAASPATVSQAGSTTISYRVTNRGSQTVTESYAEKIYLSTKTTLDGTAIFLGQSHAHTADLALNAIHDHSQLVVLPAQIAPGAYFVLVQGDSLNGVVEANEANNVTPLAVVVAPPPPGEIVMDNAPAGVQDAAGGRTFGGTWCKSTRPEPFGLDSLYACGTGLDTYRWTPTLAAMRTYDVHVWWTAASTRSTAVPITVAHDGGSTVRTFNQQTGGGRWQLHGRYVFGPGSAGYVEVSDSGGPAAADAVRLVPVE